MQTVRMSFAPGEHLLSAWMRYNLRLGFAHLSFDRCLQYWKLPKQHLKSQRVSGEVTDTIVSQLAGSTEARRSLLMCHTNYRLWILSDDTGMLNQNLSVSTGRPNLETNVLAFPVGWQLCSECVAENRNVLGYSYWHRDHQLPSVTHCLKHHTPLLTHDSLKKLHKLALPQSYLSLPLHAVDEVSELLEWSKFVSLVDRLIAENSTLPSLWREQVKKNLELPHPVKHTHRPIYKALGEQMENSLGEVLLCHLFKAWKAPQMRKPNLLWMTLSGMSSSTLRHPVYWLVVLYWQREKLTGLGAS